MTLLPNKNSQPRSIGLWLLLASITALAACQTNPITGRSQFLLTSDEALGRQSSLQYQQLLVEANHARALDRNAKQAGRVEAIMQRLQIQAMNMRPETSNWPWEVHVLHVDQVNAWCMAGGKMAVYTGLLNKVKPTDAKLAVVMGHEIAHALLSHQAEGASRQTLTGVGMTALCVAQPGLCAGSTGQLTGMVAELGILRPHSRTQESEADEVGLRMAAAAGFDPRAAVSLWQKMAAAGGGRIPEFLSTHPSPENRQQHLAQLAQELMPIYEAARRER